MQSALSQMDALAAWVLGDQVGAAPALVVPASWFEDSDGVIHGKDHLPGSTSRRGTLGELLGRSRCSKKGCSSAFRFAGELGASWASLAQLLAQIESEFTTLQDQMVESPGKVALSTDRLLGRIAAAPAPTASDIGSRLESLREAAVAAWRDPARQEQRITQAVRQLLVSSEEGPLAALGRVTCKAPGVMRGLAPQQLLADCDGTESWVENFLSAYRALPGIVERDALLAPRVEDLDSEGLRARLVAGAPLLRSLTEAHLEEIEKLAHEVPAWWDSHQSQLMADPRTMVVVVPGEMRDGFSEFELYRERPLSPLLLAPVPVGEWLAFSFEGATCMLDAFPDSTTLDLARRLTLDALAAGEGPSDEALAEIFAVSDALART